MTHNIIPPKSLKLSEFSALDIPPLDQRPAHIAIIMDGNGRWAQARGLPRTAGHQAGVNSLRDTVRDCAELEIEALTVFAFSSENWSRPLQEVQCLLNLFAKVLQREVEKLYEENIRLRIVGDLSRFSQRLQTLMRRAEKLTENNTGMLLNIAVNYGGQWEITQAVRKIAEQVAANQLDANAITEDMIQKNLSFPDIAPPDLLIRTSGEQRISNFLLWHLAYTELYFTPAFWPDFDKNELLAALREYAQRQRRFGLTDAQMYPKQVQGA